MPRRGPAAPPRGNIQPCRRLALRFWALRVAKQASSKGSDSGCQKQQPHQLPYFPGPGRRKGKVGRAGAWKEPGSGLLVEPLGT